mgnify:CR=1 FL=1
MVLRGIASGYLVAWSTKTRMNLLPRAVLGSKGLTMSMPTHSKGVPMTGRETRGALSSFPVFPLAWLVGQDLQKVSEAILILGQ